MRSCRVLVAVRQLWKRVRLVDAYVKLFLVNGGLGSLGFGLLCRWMNIPWLEQ